MKQENHCMTCGRVNFEELSYAFEAEDGKTLYGKFNYCPACGRRIHGNPSVLFEDAKCDFKNFSKNKKETFDDVGRPSHYCEGRKYEPINVIYDWGLDFDLGNALKYISRAGRKHDAVEDLKKSIWYIQDEIERLQENELF